MTSSTILIPCPNCHRSLRTRTEHLGQPATCKHCGHNFWLRYYIPVQCPGCEHELKIRAEYLGRSIECNHCSHRFVPDRGAPTDSSRELDPTSGEGAESSEHTSQAGVPGDEALAHIAELESKLDAAYASLASQESLALELARSRSACDELLARAQDLEARESDTRRLRQELESRDILIESARTDRDAAIAEVAELRTRIESLLAERVRLEDALRCANEERERLDESVRAALVQIEENSLSRDDEHRRFEATLRESQARWEEERQAIFASVENQILTMSEQAEEHAARQKSALETRYLADIQALEVERYELRAALDDAESRNLELQREAETLRAATRFEPHLTQPSRSGPVRSNEVELDYLDELLGVGGDQDSLNDLAALQLERRMNAVQEQLELAACRILILEQQLRDARAGSDDNRSTDRASGRPERETGSDTYRELEILLREVQQENGQLRTLLDQLGVTL